MITHTFSVTGMTCQGCANTVAKKLQEVKGIHAVAVSLENKTALLTLDKTVTLAELQNVLGHYEITDGANSNQSISFWGDKKVWLRASFNTLNCLIGCSIGDFGMIIFLQAYYPQTTMAVQMVLAVIAGLLTSVAFETILLKWREGFAWKLALSTAISMSFISMIAMELVMNTTDFMITGGKAAFDNPLYWTALIVAMVAGFLAPLPYNYFKLKKYNKACH